VLTLEAPQRPHAASDLVMPVAQGSIVMNVLRERPVFDAQGVLVDGAAHEMVQKGSDDLSCCSTEQTRHVDSSKGVWWRVWVLIIICLTKPTQHVNWSIWVWWSTWVLCRPCMWVPDIVNIFLCVTSITSNIYQNNST